MDARKSTYLRLQVNRLNELREAGKEDEFDGHHDFCDIVREVKYTRPNWFNWAHKWCGPRTALRRRHKKNTRRGVARRFGKAFLLFESALSSAEFVNHSMRHCWQTWETEGPDTETGRVLLGEIDDSVGGKCVKLLLLIGMHAKIIILGEEILYLLKEGYPDGAASRVRTLYETTIKACVIASDASDSGWELAERYYVSNFIEKYGSQWRYMDLEGIEEQIRDAALRAWGDNFFKNGNNWAALATGDGDRRRVSFSDIEDVLHAEPVKHIYRQCNAAVHAGPTQFIQGANFDRDYIFSSRNEVNIRSTGFIGQTATFLIEFGTMEILRWVGGDTREWDRAAFSAADFVHQIDAANEEFGTMTPD